MNCSNVWSRVIDKAALIFLLNSLMMTAAADVYKWTGEDGRVHYSDRQPQDIECEQIEIEHRDLDKCAAEIAESRRRLEEAEKQADHRIEERRKKSAAEQASRDARVSKQQQCLDARKQLAVLQTQIPVYRDTEGRIRAAWMYDTYKGEREYLDDAVRAAEINSTKKLITANCHNPDDREAQVQARKQWIRSERCAASRSQLQAMRRPQAKSTDQAIQDKQREVDLYCKDE